MLSDGSFNTRFYEAQLGARASGRSRCGRGFYLDLSAVYLEVRKMGEENGAVGAGGRQQAPARAPADLLDSVLPGASDVASEVDAADDELEIQCPRLFALLTRTRRSDGASRQVCSLTLFTESGQWKACLHERDHDLSLWATSDCLGGLWQTLERRLTEAHADWRKPRARPRPGR